MNTKLLAAIAVAASLAAAPAIAQQSGTSGQTGQMGQSGQAGQTQTQNQQDYSGWPVFSSDGQQIGTVASAEEGKLTVEMDQALGMGSKSVEVEQDNYNTGENRINLTMSAEEAKQLPGTTQ